MSIPKDVQDLRKEICTKDTKIKDLQRQLKSLNTEKQAFHLQVHVHGSGIYRTLVQCILYKI